MNSPGYAPADMFAATVRDEADITDFCRAGYPGLPYVLFGFSFGSFAARSFVARYGDRLDGAVIGGSSHKKDFNVYLGAVTAAVLPSGKPARLIEITMPERRRHKQG